MHRLPFHVLALSLAATLLPLSFVDGAVAAEPRQRVELLSERSEYRQVFRNPDGSTTVEQYAYPQRARRPDGTWAALDPTLVRNPDGSVSPRVSTVGMRFSGGGEGKLADSAKVALSWEGKLPVPELSGNRATYREVLPEVDLVVTARDTGFSEVLVVHSRAAALNPALRRLDFGVSRKDGLAVGTPMMWDSSSAQAGADHPGQGGRTARMGLDVTATRLSLSPDTGLLLDPQAKFPLYLDPTFTDAPWAMISSSFPNQQYFTYDKTDCPPGYSGECAKVGTYDVNYRSMFRYPMDGITGKQILGAKFSLDLLHSASCSDKVTELRVVNVGPLSTGTTWNNTASLWAPYNAATVSNSSCSDARKLTEFDLTPTVAAAASQGWGAIPLGLKAQDESYNPSPSSGWKKFDAKTAKLVVTTNDFAATPTGLTVDGKACATGAAKPYVATTTPTLRALLHDNDGNAMRGWVGWDKWNGSKYVPSGFAYQDSVPNDTNLVRSTSTLQDGQTYRFWAQGDDGHGEFSAYTSFSNGWDVFRTMLPLADYDNDGKPDIAGMAGSDLWIHLNTSTPGNVTKGTGFFESTGWATVDTFLAADFDVDGKTDLIGRSGSSLYVWRNIGSPGNPEFSGTIVSSGVGGLSKFLSVSDYDNDGKPDVVGMSANGDQMLFFRNTSTAGSPSIAGSTVVSSGWATVTTFLSPSVDFDGDGKTDVVGRTTSGYLLVWRGLGTPGSFSVAPYVSLDTGWEVFSSFLPLADQNGDGKADIGGIAGDSMWVHLNSSTPGSPARTGGHYVSGGWGNVDTFQAADFDGDGRSDLLTRDNGYLAVFRARGQAGRTVFAGSPPIAGPCEFVVDVTAPTQATVSSDIYTSGCSSCGSVGRTGQFTFGSSADTVSYLWGWSDPPSTVATAPSLGAAATVRWTPTTGGAKTLYVKAVDRAGNTSATRTHQFFVAPPAPAAARWKMDETAGTSLADDTGNGRSAVVSGAVFGVSGRLAPGLDGQPRSALGFDGVNDYAYRADFLDTSKAYSLSAWVKLADKAADRPVASQAGAFALGYVKTSDRWSCVNAVSTTVPRAGAWANLTCVIDPVSQTVQLYVNGVLEATATGSTVDSASDLHLGRNGSAWLSGSLAEVQVWDRAVTSAEVTSLAAAVLVDDYQLEDVGPGPSFDAAPFARDLNFFGGVQIPPTGAGHTGTGLRLDGVDDYAATDIPAVYTDQSFTVSAWVRLSATTGTQVFVAQASTGANPGFALSYDGQWRFRMDASAADAAHPTVASATADTPAAYHQLTGVFDAQARQLRLYVDGVLKSTVAMNASWSPWASTGPLLIGRGQNALGGTDFAHADMDEIRIYQGVA